MADRQKVLLKTKKLLDIAADSNFQGEAHNAMLAAQRLMAQHGFTMSDVTGAAEASVQREKEVVTEYGGDFSGRLPWWHGSLAVIIADNFRCTSYTRRMWGKRAIMFLGLKEDVERATDVYAFAIAAAQFCADRYMSEHRDEIPSFRRAGTRNDFLHGFTRGLREKFREQVETHGYALVLVKDALVVQATENLHLGRGTASHAQFGYNSGAREAGYKKGAEFASGQRKRGGNPLSLGEE